MDGDEVHEPPIVPLTVTVIGACAVELNTAAADATAPDLDAQDLSAACDDAEVERQALAEGDQNVTPRRSGRLGDSGLRCIAPNDRAHLTDSTVGTGRTCVRYVSLD